MVDDYKPGDTTLPTRASASPQISMKTTVPQRAGVRPTAGFTLEHWRNAALLSVYTREGDLITGPGLDWLQAKVAGPLAVGTPAGGGKGTYLKISGIGTGAATPGSAQTGLGFRIYKGTVTYTKLSARGSARLQRSFSIGSTYAMRECGLFVQGSAGTMFCRGPYPVRNVVSGDTITLRYNTGFTPEY